jgi:hypothetical protein
MSRVIAPFSRLHVPTGDDANRSTEFSFEDEHEQAAGAGRAKRRVVSSFRLPIKRAYREYLLRLFRLHAMAESQVQDLETLVAVTELLPRVRDPNILLLLPERLETILGVEHI